MDKAGRMRIQRNSTFYFYLIILITLFIIVIQLFRYLHINVDDKYIYYKYVQNFIKGYGLCYSRHEPVEGFSSFLYVLILAIPFRLFNLVGSDINTIIAMSITGRIVSLLFTFGTIIYLGKILRQHLKVDNLVIFNTLVLLSLNINFVYHATNGMETGVFIFLLTGLIYYLLHYFFSGRGMIQANIYSCLLVLARSDGFVYIFIIYIVYAGFLLISKKYNFHTLGSIGLKLLVPVIITCLSYESFRILYFKDYLPNTYYAKVNTGRGNILARCFWYYTDNLINPLEMKIITFLFYSLRSIGIYIVFTLFILFVYYGKKNDYPADTIRMVLFFFIISLIMSLYIAVIGGDWMPGYRYTIHFLPLFHIFSVSVFIDFVIKRHYKAKQTKVILTLSMSLIIFSYVAFAIKSDIMFNNHTWTLYKIENNVQPANNHSFWIFRSKEPLKNYFSIYSDFTLDLKKQLCPGDSVAFYEAGCPSLLIGDHYDFIDIGGLNDRVFSRYNSTEGVPVLGIASVYYNNGYIRCQLDEYLVKKRPAFIVFNSFFNNILDAPEYILDGNYQFNESKYNTASFFLLYKRVDG